MKSSGVDHIVVGVDLSSYSSLVVKQAQALSGALQIPVVYVYVVNSGYFAEPTVLRKPEMVQDYRNVVRKRYRLLDMDEVVIRFGRPFEELTSVADKKKKPMILVGYRGQNAMARFFLGSTAERVALLSPYPVWVHRGSEAVIPKKILIPCDLSPRSKRTIQSVTPLLKKLHASAELLYVIQEPTPVLDYQLYALMYDELLKIEKEKIAKFRRRYPSLKAVRSMGGVVTQIRARAKKADLIAVSPRSEHESAPYFGSLTAKLLRSGDHPVLVMP